MSLRMAFKEWAVVVDALGRGEQILLLRKGGIHEGRGGYQLEHREFLLFPTRFHQQQEGVLPAIAARWASTPPESLPTDSVRLEFTARAVAHWQVLDPVRLESLRPLHVWTEEVLTRRFDWGKDRGLQVTAVRVARLPAPVTLPLLPAHGGCRSWVDLEADVPVEGAAPVLTDPAFADSLAIVESGLGPPTFLP